MLPLRLLIHIPTILGALVPYSSDGIFKNSLLFFYRLAWSTKVQLPILITVCFMAFDIRLQLEINIFWAENQRQNRRNNPDRNEEVNVVVEQVEVVNLDENETLEEEEEEENLEDYFEDEDLNSRQPSEFESTDKLKEIEQSSKKEVTSSDNNEIMKQIELINPDVLKKILTSHFSNLIQPNLFLSQPELIYSKFKNIENYNHKTNNKNEISCHSIATFKKPIYGQQLHKKTFYFPSSFQLII